MDDTSPQSNQETLRSFLAAVSADLDDLARLHASELDADLLTSLKEMDFPKGTLRFHLTSSLAQDASALLAHALSDLSLPISSETVDHFAADFAHIYLNFTYRISPNESFWLTEEGLERQEPMFRIRDYYRRYHLKAGDWRKRSDDNLVLQLQFIQHLLTRDNLADLQVLGDFLDEHLLRWMGPFAQRVSSRCEVPFYAGLAMLTQAYLEDFRLILASITGKPRRVLDNEPLLPPIEPCAADASLKSSAGGPASV